MENGYPEYFGKVINAINFIAMDLQIDGQTIDLATTPYEDFSLELDMQNGVLSRQFTIQTPKNKVRFLLNVFKLRKKKQLTST